MIYFWRGDRPIDNHITLHCMEESEWTASALISCSTGGGLSRDKLGYWLYISISSIGSRVLMVSSTRQNVVSGPMRRRIYETNRVMTLMLMLI